MALTRSQWTAIVTDARDTVTQKEADLAAAQALLDQRQADLDAKKDLLAQARRALDQLRVVRKLLFGDVDV